jgi:hypothetical protein
MSGFGDTDPTFFERRQEQRGQVSEICREIWVLVRLARAPSCIANLEAESRSRYLPCRAIPVDHDVRTRDDARCFRMEKRCQAADVLRSAPTSEREGPRQA